jgi:hypothetical protein
VREDQSDAGADRGEAVNDERRCQWIDKKPVYLKKIGNMNIDRSEWEGDKGAFFRYEETPCGFIADPGKK